MSDSLLSGAPSGSLPDNRSDPRAWEDFHIRTYIHPQDTSAVLQVWHTAGPGIQVRRSDDPAELEKKQQRDPDLFLVAERQGEIVGTVLGGFDGRRGMMYHLAVDERFRRQGLALRLMGELEKRLRAKGCIRYYLLVTHDNHEAIRFYEQHGWERMELFVYGKDLD